MSAAFRLLRALIRAAVLCGTVLTIFYASFGVLLLYILSFPQPATPAVITEWGRAMVNISSIFSKSPLSVLIHYTAPTIGLSMPLVLAYIIAHVVGVSFTQQDWDKFVRAVKNRKRKSTVAAIPTK